MKARFKGLGITPDGYQQRFSSNDGYCKLDGLKLQSVGFAAVVSSHEEVAELMDYLNIIRCGFKHGNTEEPLKLNITTVKDFLNEEGSDSTQD